MTPKRWERIIIKWRKSYIEGGSKLAGKKGQFSMGIFIINFPFLGQIAVLVVPSVHPEITGGVNSGGVTVLGSYKFPLTP